MVSQAAAFGVSWHFWWKPTGAVTELEHLPFVLFRRMNRKLSVPGFETLELSLFSGVVRTPVSGCRSKCKARESARGSLVSTQFQASDSGSDRFRSPLRASTGAGLSQETPGLVSRPVVHFSRTGVT